MSDGDALLRAVIDHPNELTPRLAFADWLDETGRPAMARVYRADCWRPGGHRWNHDYFARAYPDLGGRAVYLPGATPGVVELVDRGVVFVMKWWNTPSVTAFHALADALRRHDPSGGLLVVVVDDDGVAAEFYSDLIRPPLLHPTGPAGAVWVRGGRPFLPTHDGNTADHLRTAIRDALGES